MCTPSLHAAFGIWRLYKGVAHVILVPSLPKNPLYGTTVQIKVPGGGVNNGEDAIAGGSRETKEEVGIVMKHRFHPQLLTRKSEAGGHMKEGYAVPRNAFRGAVRTVTIEDGDTILYRPIEVPIDEAIRIVFHTEKNKFHLNFLLDLEEYLEKKGVPTTGPALNP